MKLIENKLIPWPPFTVFACKFMPYNGVNNHKRISNLHIIVGEAQESVLIPPQKKTVDQTQ